MTDATAPTEREQGALSIRDVTKRFGAIVAVDDVSLDLPAGCFFSLLGPSGCGKTTLLRMIAGLEDPDEGAIVGDGKEVTAWPPERRPFNIVFQRYALFPHFTVFDNVAFGLTTDRRRRPPRDELRRRVTEMLRLVGLEGFEARMPGQLSGGQAQRVSVARALIRRPQVLLLDEPMAALDRNIRHQVREELLRIHSETKTTFLMVTHDQDEALSISQLVGLMNDGRLEQVADPETLYHQPATLFAARFVGAGCFAPGRVVGRSEGAADVDVQGIRFSAGDAGTSSGDVVQVLLRPEDLALVETGLGRVAGAVETCAFFGSYYELTVRTPIALFRLRSSRPSAPGTNVGIDWPAQAGIAYPSPEASLVPVVSDDVDPALVGDFPDSAVS
jgi:spermidine/putrescine transport system ATP-binding protein